MVFLTFDNPVYLWYFMLIPVLLVTHFLSLHSAKRKGMHFANFHTLKRIAGKRFVTKNTSLLIMRLIALSLIILSLAEVVVWYEDEFTSVNAVIAIDTSSSMSAKDIKPNRLEASKSFAKDFVKKLNVESKVGIISFSGVTLVQQTLTNDFLKVYQAINKIENIKSGGTDIPGAIIAGTNLLISDENKGKVIIILTDGSSTLGNFVDKSMNQALEYASQNQVIIHAIGVGSESSPIGYLPEYYNISATYNENILNKITNSTGGILIQAVKEENIKDGLDKIFENKEKGFLRFDISHYCLLAGLLFLFIEWGLLNTRFRRIT